MLHALFNGNLEKLTVVLAARKLPFLMETNEGTLLC